MIDMEALAVIREYAPIRGLRLFTSIPEGHKVIRINHAGPGSIYSRGTYVVIDPSQTDLVEGIDVAMTINGGPSVGFGKIAVVAELCRAFGGWCTAPAGGAHSQIAGAGNPVRLMDGPMRAEGLQKSIIGRVVGYLGEIWGEPIKDLWPIYEERPLVAKRMDLGDLPRSYVMECSGVCLEPAIKDRSKLRFSTTDAVEPGDIASFWLKPIHAYEPIPFQAMIKRLVTPLPVGPFPLPDYMPAPPVAIVEMDNPARKFVIPLDRVMAVHKCQGVYDGPQWKPTREEMRQLVSEQHAGWPT